MKIKQLLAPDTELMDFFCMENEKDVLALGREIAAYQTRHVAARTIGCPALQENAFAELRHVHQPRR